MKNIQEILDGEYTKFYGKKNSTVTQKKIEYILKNYKELWKAKLQEETGLNYYQVNKILNKYKLKARELTIDENKLIANLSTKHRDYKLSEEDRQLIREFADSNTAKELADIIGGNVTNKDIYAFCRTNNIKLKKATYHKRIKQYFLTAELTENQKEFIDEYRTKLELKEIIRRLNTFAEYTVSEEKVKEYLKDKIYLTDEPNFTRIEFLESLIRQGITDENTLYNKVFITRDVLKLNIQRITAKIEAENAKVNKILKDAAKVDMQEIDRNKLAVSKNNTLLYFDKAIDKVVEYANNHPNKVNKEVIYYILEINGFEKMMKEMENLRNSQ